MQILICFYRPLNNGCEAVAVKENVCIPEVHNFFLVLNGFRPSGRVVYSRGLYMCVRVLQVCNERLNT